MPLLIIFELSAYTHNTIPNNQVIASTNRRGADRHPKQESYNIPAACVNPRHKTIQGNKIPSRNIALNAKRKNTAKAKMRHIENRFLQGCPSGRTSAAP